MSVIPLSGEKLSVIVFGPGLGESIVVHAPPATWVVIDGCTIRGTSPAAELLNDHGAIWSAVVLTHPHLDHARGLDAVLAMAGSGPLGCVSLDLPGLDEVKEEDPDARTKRGVVEQVLQGIQTRWSDDPATEWRLQRGQAKTIGELTLTVLHPPSGPHAADPNRQSAGLRVTWRGHELILGSDVLTDDWASLSEELGALGEHVALKVPHHASHTGQHACYASGARERAWVATPYNLGKWKLPRFDDDENVAWILAQVERLNLTGLPVAHSRQHEAPCHATRQALMHGDDPAPLQTDMPGWRAGDRLDLGGGWAKNYVVVELDDSGATYLRFGPGSVVVTDEPAVTTPASTG